MPPKALDIISIIEAFAPLKLACDWDNVGLQLGQLNQDIKQVFIALDPCLAVVNIACQSSHNLLITHHPLFLSPIKKINIQTPIGQIIQQSVKNHLTIYCAHTNLDRVKGGINDWLCEMIGLTDFDPVTDDQSLKYPHGIPRKGECLGEKTLFDFGQVVKKSLGLSSVRMIGKKNNPVHQIFVCTGSGGSLIPDFIRSDADVFLTGDIRYHDARTIEDFDRAAIDIGHFASEAIMINKLASHVEQEILKKNFRIDVNKIQVERDPFITI